MKRVVGISVLTVITTVAFAQFYGAKSMQDPGSGQRIAKTSGSAIRVDQKLNDHIPLDLEFVDSNGKDVTLRDYFSDKPVILMPVFYECAGLCTMELNNMATTLRDLKDRSIGKDFTIVTFTIKPTETEEQAEARRDFILDVYGRRGAEKGWHFLVGDQKEIEKLTDAVGFRYEYDPTTGNVTHPGAAIVLTPQGKISRYFLSENYERDLVANALSEADKGKIGKRADATSFWTCYKIDPVTGQRSLNIIKLANIAAVLTLIVVAVSILVMTVKHKVASVSPPTGDGGGESG